MVVLKQRHGGMLSDAKLKKNRTNKGQKKKEGAGPWLEGGRTEVIPNNRNPTFKHTFTRIYYPDEIQCIGFDVYDGKKCTLELKALHNKLTY
jgi:hypothetical protein